MKEKKLFCSGTHTHTQNRLMALFPGPPRWAGARRELLDFMVLGKINKGRHSDHPAGRHSILSLIHIWYYYHYYNRFMALFPGPPRWADARRELLDFMVRGKINRGRHNDHPAGRHSIRPNQCPPPPSHIFYRPDALPAAQPTGVKAYYILNNKPSQSMFTGWNQNGSFKQSQATIALRAIVTWRDNCRKWCIDAAHNARRVTYNCSVVVDKVTVCQSKSTVQHRPPQPPEPITVNWYPLTVRGGRLFNGLTANDRWHRIYRSQQCSLSLAIKG